MNCTAILHKFLGCAHISESKSRTGPSCSKLTMSLVNDSLKFQMAILQIHCYFLCKKCENPLHCKGFSHFINKNNSVFAYDVGIYLTSRGLNHDVKPTKF